MLEMHMYAHGIKRILKETREKFLEKKKSQDYKSAQSYATGSSAQSSPLHMVMTLNRKRKERSFYYEPF